MSTTRDDDGVLLLGNNRNSTIRDPTSPPSASQTFSSKSSDMPWEVQMIQEMAIALFFVIGALHAYGMKKRRTTRFSHDHKTKNHSTSNRAMEITKVYHDGSNSDEDDGEEEDLTDLFEWGFAIR